MADKTKMIILGAAGRDFHDFNTVWKHAPVEVVAFTATQIPDIHGRMYPPELAGAAYPNGIPIKAEDELEALIKEHNVRLVTLAYSDLPYSYVMSQASRVHAAGADFTLLDPNRGMVKSTKPVIAVCAVRTGCGKSQTSRRVIEILKELGKTVAVCRHPMPYGDLTKQICQRFATLEDMDKHECTIEEREEYEPHIAAGSLLFAGVDYEKILRAAEAEADVVLWDGGNNDTSFFKADLYITVADPHRPGHELAYYPGETNVRLADIVVLNKVGTADPKDVATVETNCRAINPQATILKADSPCTAEDAGIIKGKRVLVVEDGPTLTHGEMRYGAGHVAARNNGAAEIIDPRPYAQGSLKGVFEKYGHLTDVLPAMGYGEAQMADLQATIAQVPCDAVIVGTPIDLAKLIEIKQPNTRVQYDLAEHDRNILPEAIKKVVG